MMRLNQRINAYREQRRSRQIVAQAHQQSSPELPAHLLILLTIPRSGSTWLMDMLRCNPYISLWLRADLFELMELDGGRYPLGLSNGPNATVPFENEPGVGTMIPLPHSVPTHLPIAEKQPYSLEKIHPAFFADDAHRFLRRIEHIRAQHGMEIKFVYQLRDPKSVLSSFFSYQQRDPEWFRDMGQAEVITYIEKAFFTMLEFARLYPGFIMDYPVLKAQPAETMTRLYQFIWPGEGRELLYTHSEAAVAATSREKRRNDQNSQFLGSREGAITGGSSEHQPIFDRYSDNIERMYAHHYATLALMDSSLSDNHEG